MAGVCPVSKWLVSKQKEGMWADGPTRNCRAHTLEVGKSKAKMRRLLHQLQPMAATALMLQVVDVLDARLCITLTPRDCLCGI